MLSQSIKIYRGTVDTPHLLLESCAGLGGLAYLIGSVYFLPRFDNDSVMGNEAATWFVIGGTFFSICAISLTYRHLCYAGNPIPHPKKGDEEEAAPLV